MASAMTLARWHATNYRYGCNIMPSDEDKHVGVQRITDAEAPSCSQKRQTRWRVPSMKRRTALACNELRMLMCHRAVRKDKHVGACRQKRQTQLPCNELRMLMRHRAVRKDKHVGVCNELPMLICHHAVRKDKYIGLQRITDAACAIAPSEKTNTKKQDRKRRTKGGGQNLVTQTMCLYCLMQVSSLSQQTPASVAMCFQEKCCLVPFLQSTDTTEHRMQQRQQNKNKGLQY